MQEGKQNTRELLAGPSDNWGSSYLYAISAILGLHDGEREQNELALCLCKLRVGVLPLGLETPLETRSV